MMVVVSISRVLEVKISPVRIRKERIYFLIVYLLLLINELIGFFPCFDRCHSKIFLKNNNLTPNFPLGHGLSSHDRHKFIHFCDKADNLNVAVFSKK